MICKAIYYSSKYLYTFTNDLLLAYQSPPLHYINLLYLIYMCQVDTIFIIDDADLS